MSHIKDISMTRYPVLTEYLCYACHSSIILSQLKDDIYFCYERNTCVCDDIDEDLDICLPLYKIIDKGYSHFKVTNDQRKLIIKVWKSKVI